MEKVDLAIAQTRGVIKGNKKTLRGYQKKLKTLSSIRRQILQLEKNIATNGCTSTNQQAMVRLMLLTDACADPSSGGSSSSRAPAVAASGGSSSSRAPALALGLPTGSSVAAGTGAPARVPAETSMPVVVNDEVSSLSSTDEEVASEE